MIIVKFSGGLGNQMFQYALGKTLSLKNDDKVLFDDYYYSYLPKGDTPRHYSLDCFNLEVNFLNKNLSKIINNAYVFKVLKKINVIVFERKANKYDDGILKKRKNIFLSGYWQTEKYFRDFREEIISSFSLKSESIKFNNYCERIRNNSVSIHVRRGDYITNKNSVVTVGFCDTDYYQRAIKLMIEKIKNPKFFIFSDEPDWVKDNLNFYGHEFEFVSGGEFTDYEELLLMSKCNNQIIANSSFSWWGAWLNQHLDKIIVAPKKWFNDDKYADNDIVPDDWIKI